MTTQAVSQWAALCCGLLLSLQAMAAKETPAPDFTLKSLSGDNVRLEEFRGQVVLLNFWATWCGPCREEIPELNALQEKYARLGFQVLGINLDLKVSDVEKFAKDVNINFPVLLDHRQKVSAAYDVSAMPSTILIDRNGIARFRHLGYDKDYIARYDQEIRKLVKE